MIRGARPDELELVRRIVHDAYFFYIARIGGRPGPMDADYEDLLARGVVHLLDLEPPPGLIVLVDQPDHLLIENVAVAPAFQGRGHGGKLLRFAEAEARRRGFDELRLQTHELMNENRELYAHLGYEETGRQDGDGFALIFMRKRVAD